MADIDPEVEENIPLTPLPQQSRDLPPAPSSFKANRRRLTPNKPRGSQFSQAELDSLLDSCATVLPIGEEEWKAVLALHNTSWSSKHRQDDGLRRRFAKMHNTPRPTGQPYMDPSSRKQKKSENALLKKWTWGSILMEISIEANYAPRQHRKKKKPYIDLLIFLSLIHI